MTFGGAAFALFFPLVFLLHWLVPRRAAAQNAVLLAASYTFVWCWNPRLILVFVLSTAVNYAVGLGLGDRAAAAAKASDVSDRSAARGLLAFGVAWDLIQLVVFKYLGFFAASVNGVLGAVGVGARLPMPHLVALVGVSFWTLTKLGYLIDVYYGRIEPCRSPLTFATFIAFFPQLMAGPIVRGRNLLPQYAADRRFDVEAFRTGGGLVFLGFFMKFYVADYLGRWVVDPVK